MTPNLKKHDENVLAAHYAKLGRKGAKARAKALSPERRVEIAKAARAVGVARQEARKAAVSAEKKDSRKAKTSGAARSPKKG